MADPTPEELERFFFLDETALALARQKRRLHNRLGWVVQWGTVRMLGMFLEDPVDVPRVVDFAAEQLGVDDPSCIKQYSERLQTQHEHAWEIRDLLGFRDFTDAEAEVEAFTASRVARRGTRGGSWSARWRFPTASGCRRWSGCGPRSRGCRGRRARATPRS